MKTWDEVSKEMQSHGTPLTALGYCKIAFDAGQASVDAVSGYDAGVAAREPEINRMKDLLKESMQFCQRIDGDGDPLNTHLARKIHMQLVESI